MENEHRCQVEIWIGPLSGVVRCQLERGHDSTWHRSHDAGWEWAGEQLWPLPPRRAA
ncbi:MAG TPA: hypothetical protein VED63_06975 [Acidimicrobiales bacterium]|nr:hypothetical protein [Acidimicrobiales bacterium]